VRQIPKFIIQPFSDCDFGAAMGVVEGRTGAE
jgi:hypothetical protein